jgi:hypothetical protein
MNLFLTPTHELRSGWKFAAYTVLFVILLIATIYALGMAFGQSALPDSQLIGLALQAAVFFPPAVATLVIMARAVDHKPLAAFGVAFHEKWHRDLVFGFIVGCGMLGVLVAGCVAVGALDARWAASDRTSLELTATVLVLLISAANEELIFRSYPLQVLMRGMGVWPAVVFISLIFGLMHASNPNASILGTVNTVLAGAMLSMAYVKTRSLWLPYGIHVAWNLGLGFIMGFPLSGIGIASLWSSTANGSELILGGGYGPEGGLISTLIFVGAAVTVRVARAPEISPTVRAALAGGTSEQ